MRTVIIISALIILSLLTVIFLGFVEMKKENSLLQSELNGRKKANEQERDSLQSQLDSIRTYFSARLDSVARSHEKSIEANRISQREIKALRGILFVAHTDSSRQKELKTLYKSYQ